MDSIPQDVLPLIISFMDEQTKRVMRLSSTSWFNLIKYNNFTLYFTRDEDLSAISKRLSKYSWPISLTFQKQKIVNTNELINNIKNLTNLTSFKAESLSAPHDDVWMQLSTLTNIERWEFLPPQTPLELVRCFTKLKFWNNFINYETEATNLVLKGLKSIDRLRYFEKTRAWPFSLLPNPEKLTSLQFSSFVEKEHSDSQMWSYLTNLKELEVTDLAEENCEIDLKYLTALEYCDLTQRHVPSFESNVNLTRLLLGSSDLEDPKNMETISNLSRLRSLNLSVKEGSASWFRPLAHLSSLETLLVCFAVEDGPTDFFQYLPTNLKSVVLYNRRIWQL